VCVCVIYSSVPGKGGVRSDGTVCTRVFDVN